MWYNIEIYVNKGHVVNIQQGIFMINLSLAYPIKLQRTFRHPIKIDWNTWNIIAEYLADFYESVSIAIKRKNLNQIEPQNIDEAFRLFSHQSTEIEFIYIQAASDERKCTIVINTNNKKNRAVLKTAIVFHNCSMLINSIKFINKLKTASMRRGSGIEASASLFSAYVIMSFMNLLAPFMRTLSSDTAILNFIFFMLTVLILLLIVIIFNNVCSVCSSIFSRLFYGNENVQFWNDIELGAKYSANFNRMKPFENLLFIATIAAIAAYTFLIIK